ncbi:hypothetical protein L3Y34_006981 [Caenorhabditis briggsae]|uniref:Uncharacterized protein n=1 Tax=Caenorhabditis briggsae TaxID=6238 RepID=A0AAE9CZ42_CAEBR|nr:hypothetical protein L3Y34_006981 [Caenorhabditis briggsae]
MQSCIVGSGIPDSRYIASPEFIVTVLHFATILQCPISAYGTYCIIFKTPKKMGSVKWLMFNLHVWSSMSDLVMSFIGIPYILLPAPAGYGLGLVDAPRLMVYFMVTLLAAIAASIVALYENRFFILFAQPSFPPLFLPLSLSFSGCHHDQALNNFVFITLSLHGVGSTIMMIFLHKPYWEFTLSNICCCFNKWKRVGDERKRSSHVSVII